MGTTETTDSTGAIDPTHPSGAGIAARSTGTGLPAGVPRGRPLMTAGLVAAVGLLAGGVLAGTAAQADGPPRRETIRLTVVDDDAGSEGEVIDAGPPGESVGDYLAFHEMLADRSGTVVGRVDGAAVFTGTGAGAGNVKVSTITLPGGQIATQTAETLDAPNGPHAVTGGTGRFQGVAGELTFEDDGATAVLRLRR